MRSDNCDELMDKIMPDDIYNEQNVVAVELLISGNSLHVVEICAS